MEEFGTISKAKWLERAEIELKGKALESLNWSYEGSTYSPFFHKEDDITSGIVGQKSSNSWELGQIVYVNDLAKANEKALESLMKGANALLFILEKEINSDELNILLKDINLEWISSHFIADRGKLPIKFLNAFKELIIERKFDPIKVRSTFDLEKKSISQAFTALSDVPNISFNRISARDHNDSIIASIATLLHHANNRLKIFSENNIEKEKWNKNIIFEVYITNHYFGNIAMIRALKLLWSLILSEWNVGSNKIPQIEIHVSRKNQNANVNTEKIIATSQALSAVVAGVDRLFIFPSDANESDLGSALGRRIALNIQHIMEHESYLADVYDPCAGSYFIEKLTNNLAEKAWEEFQMMAT